MTFDSVLPLISPRVWRGYTGGALLERLHGRPAGEDTHFPEEWIASTTRAINPGREHIADEGLSRLRLPDGSTPYVRDVLAQHALPLLGEAHVVAHGPTSDVLVKFLDSAVRLAIQAHPLPQFSRRHL
ncbi:MAG: hypothetical protein IT545_16830, partial [Rhodobacteraceae bacterium]|nr:hypothetical protein [Paracoccaceae bacterium]